MSDLLPPTSDDDAELRQWMAAALQSARPLAPADVEALLASVKTEPFSEDRVSLVLQKCKALLALTEQDRPAAAAAGTDADLTVDVPSDRWSSAPDVTDITGAQNTAGTHAGWPTETPPRTNPMLNLPGSAGPAGGAFGLRTMLSIWGVTVALHVVLVAGLSFWLAPKLMNWSTATPATVVESIATISEMRDVQWSSGCPTFAVGEKLTTGAMLDLDHGMVEVALQSGARVILQGPSRFRVMDANSADLRLGKLTAQVPYQARGFSVALPAMKVVDLGTEFLAQVDRDGHSEVHVIAGEVESTPLTGKAGTTPHAIRLAAGQALRCNVQTGTTTPMPARGSTYSSLAAGVRSRPYRVWIDNPSFEESIAPDGSHLAQIPGWKASLDDNWGVHSLQAEFKDAFPDGRQMGFLNEGEIWQVLRERLSPGMRYELTLWIGHRLPGKYPAIKQPLKPNYCVELWAGDQLLTSNTNGQVPGVGHIVPLRLEYLSTIDDRGLGEPLKIVIRSLGSLSTATQNHFDNLQLIVTPVL